MKRLCIHLAVAACWALAAAPAQAQRTPIAKIHNIPVDVAPQVDPRQCGDFNGHFGPIDFRIIDPGDRRNVETNHFNMELQTFLAGRVMGRTRAGVGSVVGGFNYTLKAIPNHPTGLLVMEQVARKLKNDDVSEYPLECYYLRAFMVAPDDPVVRAMYGIYLGYRGREREALANLKIGDDALHDSGSMQHYIGLAHERLKQYERAQLNAMRAAKLRFPIDVLEKSLREGGHWNAALVLPPETDDDAEQAAGAASAPAAAASASSAPTAVAGEAPPAPAQMTR